MATSFTFFVFMLIRLTALVLKQIFFQNLLVVARLGRLISIKRRIFYLAAIMKKVYSVILYSVLRPCEGPVRHVLLNFNVFLENCSSSHDLPRNLSANASG